MLNIILTIDYEVFGDGSGDVKKHIIKPTEKILNICDKYAVPLTIMFEVNEYQKFIEYESDLIRNMGYSPAQEMKSQVLDAYLRGHDVQLHIHPQWVDAEYKNGKWIMKDPNCSITEFSEKQIDEIFCKGKRTIEEMIYAVDPKYSVSAMRLTNLPWVEAPIHVHHAMKKNSIYFHSLSVSESPKNNRKGLWSLDVEERLFEIPIHSLREPGFRLLTWNRLKAAFYRRIFSKGAVRLSYSNDISQERKLVKFFRILSSPQSIKWDFCKQSNIEMIRFLRNAMIRYDYIHFGVPLIMIGHSKDFFNSKNLDLFLKFIKNEFCDDDAVKFSTMSKFCNSKP